MHASCHFFNILKTTAPHIPKWSTFGGSLYIITPLVITLNSQFEIRVIVEVTNLNIRLRAI